MLPDFLPNFAAQPGRGVPAAPMVSPTQRESDEAELHAGLNKVAGIVADARGVSEILRDVAEFAVQAIPGVDGAGVALVRAIVLNLTLPDRVSCRDWRNVLLFDVVGRHEGCGFGCMRGWIFGNEELTQFLGNCR